MTYSGTLNVSESAKANISETVRDVVRRELDNVELTATYTPSSNRGPPHAVFLPMIAAN